jgi:hypothetical protein
LPRQLSRRGLAPSGALAKVRHPVPDWMRAHEACFVRSHVPWDGLVLARAKSREQSPATATADGQSPLGASWAPFDAAEDPPWANPTPHQDFISSTTPYSHGSCLILRVSGTLGRSQILGKLPVAACPPQRQKPVPLSRLDATVTVAPTGGRPSSQRVSSSCFLVPRRRRAIATPARRCLAACRGAKDGRRDFREESR